MLNALLIANARSGAAGRLADVDVPGHWVLDPSVVTPADVAGADLLAFFAGDGTVQTVSLARPSGMTAFWRLRTQNLSAARLQPKG